MDERSYTHMDKTGWGDGPWNDEPDKVQWVDETTGLDCLIVRNSFGALCGYVGVSPEHPWHGLSYGDRCDGQPRAGDYSDYEEHIDAKMEVHGGLTYSDRCQEGEDEAKGICHVPLPGRPADVWWFGFDCAHSWDLAPGMRAREAQLGLPTIIAPSSLGESYKTVGYVKRECASLAQQLAAVAS